ncbi:hypothetical protein SODALDRAFT_136859 [Sodiomyces alkalinus F11]|uniref:Uncharacterized protein n=1 Tax=Sodiomyces alkalinus (strain CBS 110278 / VKM F-3762 / F11) TaxID=1314773 RepID=A0A3N2PYZ5_SODAK|nr:hypothetical protein SODALDRAFT_136859 [Sodiomyces alkalinus F11]ROT39740.1 hypothetical protein SODALDRAFT_136859 [Sodiomyces alkalinus F11]
MHSQASAPSLASPSGGSAGRKRHGTNTTQSLVRTPGPLRVTSNDGDQIIRSSCMGLCAPVLGTWSRPLTLDGQSRFENALAGTKKRPPTSSAATNDAGHLVLGTPRCVGEMVSRSYRLARWCLGDVAWCPRLAEQVTPLRYPFSLPTTTLLNEGTSTFLASSEGQF